jgi:hypothetical protein
MTFGDHCHRMAYVPGPSHDLFLSYAHKDAEWVAALQEQLTERLLHRLGWDCEVWQDVNKLRTGQNWPDGLDRAVRASAAFLAVVSRNYPSGWCEKELDTFIQECRERAELEAGGFGRLLKVIRLPWDKDAHLGFHREYQHIEFFSRDSKTGQPSEFRPTSEPFWEAVDKLSFHIENLFKAMLRLREKVFVARGAPDTDGPRAALIRQIRAEGYAISPPPDGRIARGTDAEALKPFVAEAHLTIHLLGAETDRCIREQIDLAIEAEKHLVFCLAPGYAAATGEQKKLIDDVRNNKLHLPDGSWKLIENRSITAMTKDVVDLLAPPPPTSAAAANGPTRVYLMCDPNTPEDVGFAREIQNSIWEKEQMQVELPRPAAESTSASLRHERLLSECDGLLLYKEKAPRNWFARNCGDLVMAELRERTRELKSKAMLIAGIDEAYPPGLSVIHRREPFDIEQLDDFLDPLRGMSKVQGGAHARS